MPNLANGPSTDWKDSVTEPGKYLFSSGSEEPGFEADVVHVFRLRGSKRMYVTTDHPDYIENLAGMHGKWKKCK